MIYAFIGALLLTSITFAENTNPKIVVVGAGIAGLTTAHRLKQKGADVHLYEARARVGGRIFTVKVAGNISELGGQNLSDGGEAVNTHRLIEEFDLELYEEKIPLTFTYFTGKEQIPMTDLSGQINPEKIKDQIDAQVKKSSNMKEVLDGLLEKDSLLYKAVATKLAAFEGGSIENLSTAYAETLYYALLGGIAPVHAGETEEQYLTLQNIKEGNALLMEKMAESLGERVHLNKVLTSIAKEKNGYQLTFKDGEKVQVDILVLARPCSVYMDISFEGDVIPPERLAAITDVQYGQNARILVPFTEPAKELGAMINDRLIGFFAANSSLYTLFYVGETSRFTQETIESVYSKDRPMIEKVYPGLCPAAMPEYARDESFGIYEGPVGYSWPNDPYVKGSYSYIAPGQEAVFTELAEINGETVKMLFAPIDQKLYFAGEHATILVEIPGTIEAACESGERAARMILKSLEKSI